MSNKKTYKIKDRPFVEAIQYIGTNKDKVIAFGEGAVFEQAGKLIFKTSLDIIPINVGDFVQRNEGGYPAFIVYREEEFLTNYEEKPL